MVVREDAEAGWAGEGVDDRCPEGLSRIFFCNAGAEGNENGMKVARKATGRQVILSFEGSVHGRTAGAWTACQADPGAERVDQTLDEVVTAVGGEQRQAEDGAVGRDQRQEDPERLE